MRAVYYASSSSALRRRIVALLALIVACFVLSAREAAAHPLGNFTINHFTRIEVGAARLHLHYVVDMAEIPTFQESQTIDANNDHTLSPNELNAYLERVLPQYAAGLLVSVDDQRVALQPTTKAISLPQGAGGLPTLRLECDFEGMLPAKANEGAHRLRFEDANHRERIGWREIVVRPAGGVVIFDSTAFGSSVTDELKNYPQDMLAAPLDERACEFSWLPEAMSAMMPNGSAPLRLRDGRAAGQARDSFAELINVPQLTPVAALLGLLLAAGLGALHAFSPGHGKTIVGAYLVGSRGTAKHAAFLGVTVTITHTIGVFALGLVTLFASAYIVPEKIFPVLSFASGAIVTIIGLNLFARRLRYAFTRSAAIRKEAAETLAQGVAQIEDETNDANFAHEHKEILTANAPFTHSHGGREHTHLPPGADGRRVTWRSLLALGVSGGLLPCPSALVVLLSAISLHRISYGLLLVVAFSFGLAATLTAIGLAFVYAGRFIKRPVGEGRLVRFLPIVSALVIACIGAGICYEALTQAGVRVFAASSATSSATSSSSFGVARQIQTASPNDGLAR